MCSHPAGVCAAGERGQPPQPCTHLAQLPIAVWEVWCAPTLQVEQTCKCQHASLLGQLMGTSQWNAAWYTVVQPHSAALTQQVCVFVCCAMVPSSPYRMQVTVTTRLLLAEVAPRLCAGHYPHHHRLDLDLRGNGGVFGVDGAGESAPQVPMKLPPEHLFTCTVGRNRSQARRGPRPPGHLHPDLAPCHAHAGHEKGTRKPECQAKSLLLVVPP